VNLIAKKNSKETLAARAVCHRSKDSHTRISLPKSIADALGLAHKEELDVSIKSVDGKVSIVLSKKDTEKG